MRLRFGRGAMPLGLLGMLALVAGVELSLARHPLAFRNSVGLGWHTASRAAARRAPRAEILLLGDSTVQFGVAPRVIEARLGRRAYSLAIGCGPVASSFYLLRQALAAGATPRAVVVDFAPFGLDATDPGRPDLWAELLTTRDALDLAWHARDPGRFAGITAARLPSVRDRHAIRTRVVAALGGAKPSRSAAAAFVRNWRVNAGAQIMPRTAENRGDLAAYAGALFPPAWRVEPRNRRYVERLLDLATARGIPVFWLIPPFSPEAHARREALGLEAAYTAFARSLLERYPLLSVIDGREARYDDAVRLDPIHLDARGAAVLSADLADVLGRALDGRGAVPRWAALPPYADRPAGVALEDVGQSAAIVAREADRARR